MSPNRKLKVAVLPGDGIGQEVTHAVLPLFDALQLPLEYELGDIGWGFWEREADPIPKRTWDLMNKSDATLLGAITSKPEREAKHAIQHLKQYDNVRYVSPIIQMRQTFDLFANVRPVFTVQGSKQFKVCVIRENTEGLYSGFDYDHLPEDIRNILSKDPKWVRKLGEPISCSLRLQSHEGLMRIFTFAFEYALKNNYKKVSFADKPNVLRQSSAFARVLFEEVAAQHPSLEADILNVDAVGMHLVTRPESLSVIVAENMFGDILSDVAAGVMGGLGLAPSANIGFDKCYFEPVHGSGPRMKPHAANPSAMFFSLSMLLSHFGFTRHAQVIKEAVLNVIHNKKCVTRDLGGKSTTEQMADAIITEAKNLADLIP